MDCETAKGLLSAHHDDELDRADRALVAQHVEHCSACARELEWLAKLDRDGRLLLVPEPPPDMWVRIEKRLAIPQKTRTAVSRAFSRRQLMVAIGAVAISAVGVYVTSSVSRHNEKPIVPEFIQPVQHIHSIAPNAVLANQSEMSPEDRRRVEVQEFCANELCNEPLAISGEPVKVVLQNKIILFVCSHDCELWVRGHPNEAIENLHSLEYRHLRKLHGGPKR
jgi:Putative zinc-finger